MIGMQFKTSGIPLEGMALRLRNLFNISAGEIGKVLAEDFYSFFKRELKANGLQLQKLSTFTILHKKKLGQSLPTVPLYGYGDSNTKSFFNSIMIGKSGGKWYVGVDGRKRHVSGINMKQFVLQHKKGFTLMGRQVPSRDVFGNAQKLFRPEVSSFKIMRVIKERFSEWFSV